MPLPASDQLLASAARFLVDGGQEDAASVLLSCSLEVWESGDHWLTGDEMSFALHVELVGPRAAYEILSKDNQPITQSIRRAIGAVLPADLYIKHLTARAKLVDIDPDWRSELLEIARGKGVHNQAASVKKPYVWQNLRFRSATEARIAQALDKAGVLFLPNCIARLGSGSDRKNREADFLVCQKGRWGILEVDGEPFHPPSRTAEDHTRDRLFRGQGIVHVEHFNADECYNQPELVVRQFLILLESAVP